MLQLGISRKYISNGEIGDEEIRVFTRCQVHSEEVTEEPEVIIDSECECHICFVNRTEVHDKKLSATENINTVSATENINSAEKEKVLGHDGLLTEVDEVELGAAENINAVCVDYGNNRSLQCIV